MTTKMLSHGMAGAMVLVMASGAWAASAGDMWLRFVGRVHPVFVHFPIALLVVGALVEVVRLMRRRPEASATAVTCVVIGAIGAAAAAFSGWMNADFETTGDGDTLFWHRWLGVGVAVLAALTAGLALGARVVVKPAYHRVYAMLLLAVAGMVGFTAHLGGSMVYGADYFFEVLRAPKDGVPPGDGTGKTDPVVRRAPAGTVLSVDFANDVQPIFNRHCIDCHGPSKQKGGLRLDAPGHVFAKAEEEWPIRPGAAGASDLVKRLEMKKGDEGRMPPRGDPLPADEVAKIRAWIEEGAYWELEKGARVERSEKRAEPAPAPPSPASPPTASPAIEPDAAKLPPEKPVDSQGWSAEEMKALESLRALGARVEPVAAGSTALEVNLSVAGKKATDDALAMAASLGARVRTLNAARTAISDAGVQSLGACTKLATLRLEETGIGDAAMEAVAKLQVVSLSLNGTKVTDAGILKLKECRTLRSLYVAETAVTLDAAIKLQEAAGDRGLDVEVGIPK